MIETRQELTFKHNLKQGRHGWLRLTPAYSVQLVRQILLDLPMPDHVLDPFSGTGTTGLVCAEQGIACDVAEINPFLVWLAGVKTANYVPEHLETVQKIANKVARNLFHNTDIKDLWIPPISNISRWWSEKRLTVLASLYREITIDTLPAPVKNLLLIAFCRVVIESSNAAFNHQSMSFKKPGQPLLFEDDDRSDIGSRFVRLVQEIVLSARLPLDGQVRVMQADSRMLPHEREMVYDCVITSPPYPNRMSYIRELRPYMYWLGYLTEARDAGELDWQAIGGTWGIATSRLKNWTASSELVADNVDFAAMIADIHQRSPVLGNYVHKYIEDIALHLRYLSPGLKPGARVFYIVGNSKFYDTVVPTERIYEVLLRQSGFEDTQVTTLRKRNSKKELFEYIVSARKPG